MTTPVKSIAVKSPDVVRDDQLRTIRNGYIQRGVLNPQVGPGSDEYVSATAVANEISVVSANTQIMGDQLMPDSATGTFLDRICKNYGITRRTASGSNGLVTVVLSANSLVPFGSQLIDSQGLRFQVSIGGTYTNTAPLNQVPLTAIDTGKATNHVAGDVLRWVTGPPYSNNNVTVSVGGLNQGIDGEDDETLRARLLSRLQNPPGAGNWNQVAALAQAASTNVQAAFVYPAANGPATVHVAVVSYATNTQAANAKNRDVDTTTLNSTVIPYVQGNLAEYAESVITTVINQPIDFAISLALPASPLASPPGPGGGWLDGTPWPTPIGTAPPAVTAVTSTTVFTVSSNTAPTPGVSRICFLDPTTWTLNTAKVLSFTGTGPYAVTVDTPWPNIAVNNYVMPQALNTQAYISSLLAAFALMGPGEKTASSLTLSRAFRHPVPQLLWPYQLGPTQLRAITLNSAEVLNAQYLTTSPITPTVPGAVSGSPSILVPRNVAFLAL